MSNECCSKQTTEEKQIQSCCGQQKQAQFALPNINQPFVDGFLDTSIGKIPQISYQLTIKDNFGTFKVRWAMGRMDYKVDPGLYALGTPDDNSNILVSANYKLSFDKLRQELKGKNLWILVLDTKGVNVWCAAGKKTFGTEELVNRINNSGVLQVTSNRKLILPQLSAPGVSAHIVKKLSGFKVIYGPIKASDLPYFFDNGFKATPKMRKKTFDLSERISLIPVELTAAIKPLLLIMLFFLIFGGFAGAKSFLDGLTTHGLFSVYSLLIALFAGAVVTPILLPILPFRAFSLKGTLTGFIIAIIFVIITAACSNISRPFLEQFSWIILITTISSYLALNFTGTSTYTSLSGVKKEMKFAIPAEVIFCIVGLCLWFISVF